jgi:hypothetical protein
MVPDSAGIRPGNRTTNFPPRTAQQFAGDQLSAEELNLALTLLRRKTGFVRMRFDEDGFLRVEDRSQISGGSETAGELLVAVVDGKKSIILRSRNRSPEVVFARVGERMDHQLWQSDERIEMAPIEIDFADFNHLQGERKALEAFDPGFAILHELCHAALELRDPAKGRKATGDCEDIINRVRRELGMPERQHYAAKTYLRTSGTSFDKIVTELIFARTKPGAKTERLYLSWDVREVGNSLRLLR